VPERTTLLDLGGGGASITNSGGAFSENDQVELSFFTSPQRRVKLDAKVVRVTEGKGIAHLSFCDIRESTRDQIFRYLFKKR